MYVEMTRPRTLVPMKRNTHNIVSNKIVEINYIMWLRLCDLLGTKLNHTIRNSQDIHFE